MPTRPPGTPDVDLTEFGSFGSIGDAFFATDLIEPAGTGQFDTFVQLQQSGTEQGYNTDAGAQFDEVNSSQHNHSILLAEIPIFIGDGSYGTIENVLYREFLLDLNEQNSSTNPYISLDSLQIWQQEAGDLTNFTPGAGFAGAHTNYLAYDLDAGGDRWIGLNAGLSSGSGKGDLRVLIPDSFFINDAAHRYVTLYSKFGQQSGWQSGSGFEEWGTRGANGGSISAIALNKSASVPGGTADQVGEVVTYSFQLSNTGNTTLTGVVLTDALVSDLTRGLDISGNNDSTFDAGEVWSYTAHYAVTQADIDSISSGDNLLENTATADSDQTGPVSATAVVTVESGAHVTLDKVPSVPGGTADTAGEIISYAISVTNDGNVTLTSLSIVDLGTPNLAPVENPAAPILVPITDGEAIVGDLNENFIQDPGEVWTFRNAGDVNQNGIEDDSEIFSFHNIGDLNEDGELDVAESWQYNASVIVTQAMIDNGGLVDPGLSFSNTVLVAASHDVIEQFTAFVPIEQRPHVTLTKSATVPGGTADAAGEVISYAISITNDGNMTLTNPVVSDPSVGDLAGVMNGAFNTGDTDMDGALDLGETWQYTASHTVTQDDIDNGDVVDPALTISNTATVTTDQASDSDSASIAVAQNPHVAMTKTASVPGGTADLDEVISYAIAVTNDGNMTLTDPVVSDPFVSDLAAVMTGGFNFGDLDLDGKLDVGETWQYTANHIVTAEEIAAGGSIGNTASVATTQGAVASGSASVAVTLPPAIALEKTSLFVDSNENGVADTGGDLIQYVFVVSNLGGVGLTNVALIDPLLGGAIPGPDSPDGNGILDVGESWVYSKNYFLTAADVAAHEVSNDASVTALDPMSLIVSDAAHLVTLLP
jgi:uncharacterized repeat protein (TIGR01451 family)